MVEVLNVEQGERKNMRVIEKNSGKIRCANLSENRNKMDNNRLRIFVTEFRRPHVESGREGSAEVARDALTAVCISVEHFLQNTTNATELDWCPRTGKVDGKVNPVEAGRPRATAVHPGPGSSTGCHAAIPSPNT